MTDDSHVLAPRLAVLSSARVLAYIPPMEQPTEDSALMLRYRDGDVGAFELLYKRHNDGLYRYLLRLSQNPDVAADVFQDAWSKIIKARNSYRPAAKFSTFLYRVAHNCFIDHVRRNKRHRHAVVSEPDEQPHAGEAPDEATERLLARRRLIAALDDLPEEQREVYLLHEEAGLNLEQIASVADCNRETAKSRLRYAVQKLRAAIDDPVGTS